MTKKALLIEGDANGFVRPDRHCAMVMDSLQFMSVSFSCEINAPQDNGSTANNVKLVIDDCAGNRCQDRGGLAEG